MADLKQTPEEATLARLEGQLTWYDRKSSQNQSWFKVLKFCTIVSAAVIPVLATSGIPYGNQGAAALGVLIAIMEGLQQLNQYHANWTAYRGTAESLRHEKYLYLAQAGPYRGVTGAVAVLAERVETLTSQEQAKWITVQSQIDKRNDSPPAAG